MGRPDVKRRVVVRRRSREPAAPDPVAIRARADELAESGMPFQMAMAVAQGRLELNAALERLAQRAEVDRLMRDHDLTRAFATQVALGHADLDTFLAKRRFLAHREENANRSCLESAASSGDTWVFGLFEGRKVEGTISEVTTYQATLVADGAEPEELHKLAFKYAYRPDDWKRVKKAIRKNKELSAEPRTPSERPQDRYTCSDRRLFGYMDEEATVDVTLLEGEILQGSIAWFGRFEFGLRVKGDAEIIVFRHALHRIRHLG